MKKIWINVAHSFKEAEKFDRKYYSEMSANQRVSIMQELREIYYKFKGNAQAKKLKNGRKRLRRVITVIQ